jgi:hypothetical protein
MNNKTWAALGIGVLLIAGVAFALSKQSEEAVTEQPISGESITITGQYMCLPHTNSDGPQTMECAFGVKTNTSKYYALDFESVNDESINTEMNETVEVSGSFIPVGELGNQGQIYPIEGAIKVKSFKVVK